MNLQNNPGSNFLKLLREQIEEEKPRRKEFTKEEQQKLDKLNSILKKLMRGENVQNRQLQTWLSEDEYAQVDIEWDTQKLFREEL
jgi:hypothetical protein